MGVALMTVAGGGGHSLDYRVFLIRGANADKQWLWSCVVVELCGSGVCFEVGSE